MIRVRNSEREKFAKAGVQLKWFTPVPAKKAEELGIKNYEAYKM
jgi:hypothetical protein